MKVPEPESPRTRSSDVQGQEKMTVPVQEDGEGTHPSFACFSILAPSGWDEAHTRR